MLATQVNVVRKRLHYVVFVLRSAGVCCCSVGWLCRKCRRLAQKVIIIDSIKPLSSQVCQDKPALALARRWYIFLTTILMHVIGTLSLAMMSTLWDGKGPKSQLRMSRYGQKIYCNFFSIGHIRKFIAGYIRYGAFCFL